MRSGKTFSVWLVLALVSIPCSVSMDTDGIPEINLYVDSDITEDTLWSLTGSPYILNSSVRIREGATLEIGSDVVVRMGPGASMIVEGNLTTDGAEGIVTFRPDGPIVPFSWGGLTITGGNVHLEGTWISGAGTIFDASNSTVTVRNSTLEFSNSTAVINNGTEMELINSTFDSSTITVLDQTSIVRTMAEASLFVVDKNGGPKGGIEVEIVDSQGSVISIHTVNETGEVPPILLYGYSYGRNGVNTTTGSYIVVMKDVPFTHFNNRTFLLAGNGSIKRSVRFSWPPEMTDIPDTFFAYEDQYMIIPTRILDRNNAGNVDINISSENVGYDEQFEELFLVYENESISNETVIIELSDGIDIRMYSINVTVAFRNDPPEFGILYSLLYVTEGVPYHFPVSVNDEETPGSELIFQTDHPGNVVFDHTNQTMVFLFGDGSDEEMTVNITISDGVNDVTKEVFVIFTPVNFPPFFKQDLPDLIIEEDSFRELDLADYVDDPDVQDNLTFNVQTFFPTAPSFSVQQNMTRINISSLRDANGSGTVRISARDTMNNTIYRIMNVTVTPVNDPPTLTAGNHSFIQYSVVEFEVIYTDIDGDDPVNISVVVNGWSYTMQQDMPGQADDGILFKLQLSFQSGQYIYHFICSDGEEINESEIGNFTIINLARNRFIEGFDGFLNVSVLYLNNSDVSLLTDTYEGHPGGRDEVKVLSFRLTGSIQNIQVLRIKVNLSGFRNDTIPSSSRVLSIDGGNLSEVLGINYSVSSNTLEFLLGNTEMGNDIVIISLLDPDLDTDQDGYSNMVDLFPTDGNEWNDTDRDGTGDNSDPDDDGDGFVDELEIEAGTDPLSDLDYPGDLDNDDILDYLDQDDDGDGIPDEWEKTYGFDPLDPDDAVEDPDSDGRTNLREYEEGTDPLVRQTDGDGNELPWWLILVIAVLLVMLLVMGVLLYLQANRSRKEEETEEDWSVREELDPDDAVECGECGSIYPFEMEECPFCGEVNPYDEEM